MAYQRKTVDTWRIQVNYGLGDGWETECHEPTRKLGRAQLKCYQENCPYPSRMKKTRELIATK